MDRRDDADRASRSVLLIAAMLVGVFLLTGAVLPLSNYADATFLGATTYDYAGDRVAMVGDVNADGYDDFLIAAYGGRVGDNPAGAAYLFLGRFAADWGAGFNISLADAAFGGEAAADYIGRDVSVAGDVNGDGYDDFLIGAYLFDPPGLINAGKVYLVLGRSAADWGLAFNLADADASFIGEASYDYAASTLSGAGDVNGDGYDDFLIGAYGNDDAGPDAGKAYLVLGRPGADWGNDISLGDADATFLGESSHHWAGYSVAGAGDTNEDGYDDLLIGAFFNDDSAVNAGKAYLVLGLADADWGQDFNLAGADAAFLGESANDYAGYTVADAGDVNGDGLGDFLIGAAYNDEGGSEAGEAYLILGRTTADWGTSFSLSNADASFRGRNAHDPASFALSSAGDVNRDRYDDFLIGAHLYDHSDALTDTGRAYLVLGRPSGWQLDRSLVDLAAAKDILAFDGEAAQDQGATDLSGGGDVNGDGFADFLVGAPYNGENADRSGKVYLMLGKGIAIEKTTSTKTVLPGQRITYTLHYCTTTVEEVPETRIGDRLPNHTTYVGCSGGLNCVRQGPIVFWYLGAVAPQSAGTVTLTLEAQTGSPAGTIITNTAWITAPSRVNVVFSTATTRVDHFQLYLPAVLR